MNRGKDGDRMIRIECTACKKDIEDVTSIVNIIDEDGFTHTYCNACGPEIRQRLEGRYKDIDGK